MAVLLCAVLMVAGAERTLAGPKLVFDIRTGAVLHAENADDPWYPASVTKLMTTYVALSAVRDGSITLDTPLTASQNAVAQPPSKIGIALGQSITLRNALNLLIVKSANDIAVVVAEGVGGSVPEFSAMMNATARRLGMTRTRFVNPHGLPDANQVTSARDMAILSRALALEFPESTRVTRLPFVKIGDRTIRSHNALLGRYAGADGMKTGFICAAGFNIVASASRRGQRIAAVVFGENSPDERRIATERLLDLGFAAPRFGLSDRDTLHTMPRSGTADQPVNMRPQVCGENRNRPDNLPGLKEFSYSGPIVPVVFGPQLTYVPLPSPRPDWPSDTPLDEAHIVVASTDAPVAGDSNDAEAGDPSIPLPEPRPMRGYSLEYTGRAP